MEPIQPINSVDSLLSVAGIPPHPQEPVYTGVENSFGLDIDYVKLHQDQVYLLQTLEDVLFKARTLFNQGIFPDAEKLYEMFFRYYGFLPPSYTGDLQIYFPALLEYTASLEVHSKAIEAEKFLNQQLLHRLESTVVKKVPHSPSEQTPNPIPELQQQGKLPSPTNLNIRVTPDTLQELAQYYQTNGSPQRAQEVLGYLEVHQWLDLLRTRQISNTMPPPETPVHPVQLPANSFYSHWGLPILSILPPLPPEERKKFQPAGFVPAYRVEKVERIPSAHPQDKNPKAHRDPSEPEFPPCF